MSWESVKMSMKMRHLRLSLFLAYWNPLWSIHNAVYDAFDSLLFPMMRRKTDPPQHLRILFGRLNLRGRLSIKLG
jgi:hypothetical protein